MPSLHAKQNYYPTSYSVAKSVGCFQRRLFVCVFVCQHDNFRTSKHAMMKLGGRECVHCKISAEFAFGVIAPFFGVRTQGPPGCAPPKMWCSATTLGKSAQAVNFQNYFSLRRRTTEMILFQRVETCLKLFRNYFTGLLQLTNIFQHVQCR